MLETDLLPTHCGSASVCVEGLLREETEHRPAECWRAEGCRSFFRPDTTGAPGETGAENLAYYSYNAANELTQLHDAVGWTYFAYDANGNTVMEQTPSYTRYFQWDGRDMLTGVRSTEQGWTDNVIPYDGLASRASVVDSTGMTYYSWDGVRVLKTEDGARALKQRQVHGHAPIPSVGDIAHMESAAGDTYAPIPDQIGTLWKTLSSTAATANSYTYDAYGVSRSVSESFANPFRFAGKPLDPDPALYDFIARQYDPDLGRFTSRERSVGAQNSVHTYGYVMARPASLTDPRGLWMSGVPAVFGWLPISLGWPGHKQLTLEGVCAFKFAPNTLENLWEANVDTDFWYKIGFFKDPAAHFMADSSSLMGRLSCWVRSILWVWNKVKDAYASAESCRQAKPVHDIDAGQRGIILLGEGLHAVQDATAHHCMTEAEHKTEDADNPGTHRLEWDLAVRLTCSYLSAYRALLESAGWTQNDIDCCVEAPFDISYPAPQQAKEKELQVGPWSPHQMELMSKMVHQVILHDSLDSSELKG